MFPDFFLWIELKQKVHRREQSNNINEFCKKIKRWTFVLTTYNGEHIEDSIKKNK